MSISKQNSLGNAVVFFFLKQQQQNSLMLREPLKVVSCYFLPLCSSDGNV